VTRSDEVEEMTNAILTRFNRIDILVNNVGILGHPAHVVDMDEGDWDAVMNVNAKSAFLCSKAVARHMIKQRRGKIINISSTSGKQGDPLLAHYSASKFAVVGLTQALALELAPYGINVNAVCPGPTDTQMWWSLAKVNGPEEGLSPESWSEKFCKQIPLGKLNLPEDIGNLVCFLASDESRTITGIAVTISGGLRL
jgi:NAD(P)-dependent dehydrogenase (short-subunit alcohol dehydrogenase family)